MMKNAASCKASTTCAGLPFLKALFAISRWSGLKRA